MAESKKEEASTAKTQKKSAISDDFGSDFLSSWKTMSVAEDDGLDFNQEALPKGKKNMFNFDKLDMDFSLDGDFGKKMSSFNVDMPDLDFSSPVKKPTKGKEGGTEESLDGKQRGKQSRFNLSFNFNELDNFDFDSNFMKEKSKSEKAEDLKGFDSPRKEEKAPTSRSKPIASVDLPENSDTDKAHASKHPSTSKYDHLTECTAKLNANIGSSSTSVDFGNLSQSHCTAASPVKETTVSSTKETAQSSQQSERTISTERNTIQESSTRSTSLEGLVQEEHGEVCSSATENKTNPEEAPDISVKSCNWESSPTVKNPGPESTENESNKMLEKQSDSHTRDASRDDSMEGDRIINDSSVGNSAQNMLHGTGPAKENHIKSKINFERFQSESNAHHSTNEKGTVDIQCENFCRSVETASQLDPSVSKKAGCVSNRKSENVPLGLADARSKPKAPQAIKQKESCIQSKYFSRSTETESQLNTQSIPKKAGSVSNKKDENLHLGSTNARSEAKTRQPGKEKGSSIVQSKYFNKSIETETRLNSQSTSEKAHPLINKQTDNMLSNPADLKRQEHPANDAEAVYQRVNDSKSQESALIKSAPAAVGNGRHCETSEISARLPEQTVKSTTPQSLNAKLASSISTIRNQKNSYVEGNKLPPLPTAKTTLEPTPLKVSRLVTPNNASHSKALTTIKSPRTSSVSMEKRILPSPHTKRKMSEAPDADADPVRPLKRATSSPTAIHMGLEKTSKSIDEKRVYSSPNPYVPRDEGWKELQVPLLMEDDGNIEKAEAYSKELDDIRKMLKKKHDEAKELLVRALVNNNQLLMLNHPIYLEKIRIVEQLANLMLSPARQI